MTITATALDTGDFPLVRYAPPKMHEWIKNYQYENNVSLVEAKQAWNNMHWTARTAIVCRNN